MDADSDDEQCPDPEIPPAFTSVELALVNDTSENELWAWFQKAFLKNFQNAAGNFFFVGLGFLLRVHLHIFKSNLCPHVVQIHRGLPNLVTWRFS